MKPASYYAGNILDVITSSFWKRIYELNFAGEVLMKMYFPQKFSSAAIVEGFDGKWEIKRKSIWTRNLNIFKPGYQLPFSEYKSNLWGTKGTLNLSHGKKLILNCGTFKKDCKVFTQKSVLLFSLNTKFSLKDKAVINFAAQSDLLDENPWVLMFAWYVVLMNKRHASYAG